MAQSHDDVLQSLLEAQQSHSLSIIKISEPISTALAQASTTQRTSDISASEDFEYPSPASLEADLSHYKELFTKLRFSYLEQVTKEKFLRALVNDPPLIVSPGENVSLEARLLTTKASLKAQKTEVAELVAQLETRGRDLTRTYKEVQLQTTQLQELPDRIEGLRASIEELKAAQGAEEQGRRNEELCLPLGKSVVLLEGKEAERAALEREIALLKAELPRRTREAERLESEVQPLEVRRLGSVAAAREAQRRRDEALGGGVEDDLEARGRWWRGVEGGLKVMLGVEE